MISSPQNYVCFWFLPLDLFLWPLEAEARAELEAVKPFGVVSNGPRHLDTFVILNIIATTKKRDEYNPSKIVRRSQFYLLWSHHEPYILGSNKPIDQRRDSLGYWMLDPQMKRRALWFRMLRIRLHYKKMK